MSSKCPHHAVLALAHAGWSEARIALACATSQSTIHRFKCGKQKAVSYALGSALIQLAEQALPAPNGAISDVAPSDTSASLRRR